MIPAITDRLIQAAIQSPGMVNSGQVYYRQGKVGDLVIDADMGMISADVQGSRRTPYEVTIIFGDDNPDEPVEVDCSCPVGFGCKHGAATLFAAQAQLTMPGLIPAASASPSPPPPRPTALPDQLMLWLSEANAHGPARKAQRSDIIFVIKPQTLFGSRKAKVQFEGAGTTALNGEVWTGEGGEWTLPNRYDRYWIGAIPTPVGQWLARRLYDYHGDVSGGRLKAFGGMNWLEQAVATGNARWKRPDGPALHFGEPRSARFRWETAANGDQRLTLDEIPEGMTLAALAPPLLIDDETGAVHRVETGIDAGLAEQLLLLPPVVPEAVGALEGHWDRVTGGVVPPPRLDNLVERGRITPIPVLTFREEGVDVFLPRRSHYYSAGTVKMPTASGRLGFDYEGLIVTHSTADTVLMHKSDDGIIQFERDLAAEKSAFARLAKLGMKPMRSFPEAKAKAAQVWDLTIGVGATPPDYAHILQFEVPALQAEGWRIAYAPRWSLAFVELEPDSLAFDVEPSGIDWFDIGLGARIDGKTVDILPLLRQLLGRHGAELLDHPGAMLPLEVAPGKIAMVQMERIKPVLEMLLALALKEGRGNERLKLPARDLATLAELEGGTSAHIRWTGADKLRALAKALAQLELAPVQTPPAFSATLRPYQQQGLDWLQALHGAGFGGVLADDMGLGKTVQAIAHIMTLKAAGSLDKPVLIVCPTSVLPNWQAELARFAPDLSKLLWHGLTRKALTGQLGGQDVILTSYPLLARDIEVLKKQALGLVILDEAQMLKNPKTAGFKAAKLLQAPQRIALTGTPVENQLTDAWSLMELVTPGLLGPLDSFNRIIAKPITRDSDAATGKMLARRLRPFMLRRTKDQVASDLPAKTEIPEWIDLDGGQLALYESMRLLMQKKVRDEIARVGMMRSHIIVLDALLKLRQICCDPHLLQPETEAASAKLTRLMEMLPELLAEGRRVLLFSQFTSMLDLIKDELGAQSIAFAEIRGSTKDRETPVKQFQEGKVPVILVSLKAGGTGLNLTAADTVILYDPWWNPAVEAQAIDRAHRIGQTKPVFVHRLIARGTIEEKILSLQDKKRSLAATLWGEGDGAEPAKLTEEDVRFLLG